MLQCAIELVSGVARDDVQATGDAHTPTHAPIYPESKDAQESSSVAPMPTRENYLCDDGKECLPLEDSVELRGVDFP